MASDRARLSHDSSRDYRAVVLQQGRVCLEADTNEASRLAETALRQDIIDIIGPVGTPDNGYEVKGAGGSVEIGPGSYYVGGWRVALDAPMALGAGPDEVDLDPAPLGAGRHAIALLLTEQEIGAVEDHALLEVALGGPDTCQRTRLMQRAVAVPFEGEDCAAACESLVAALSDEGADYDLATAAILPRARLQVAMVAPPALVDPCDPPASGGYLGADNQLIRVAVSAFNAVRARGSLVWGYDNASTLYRASTADGKVLTLEGAPIDNDHAPRLGQEVEILQTRKLFDHGDVAAADAGLVTTVAQPYDPDLRRIEIAATLPAGARGDSDHPLFVRLWKEELGFIAGTPVELGDTGLTVTLTLDGGLGALVARPFWSFAARPSTPVIVYPRRYLNAPQPPEGPRQWIASLAAVEKRGEQVELLDDCRDTFLPLTKIRSGCCGIVLDADMRGHRDFIQRALDRLRGTRGTVTLRPGRYRLRKPIRLDGSHKGLTLEGCGEGVFLEAGNDDPTLFAEGLIVLDDVNEIALRSLQFQMPSAELSRNGIAALNMSGSQAQKGISSIAVTATGCAQLTVSECQFRFRLKSGLPMFAVGLLSRGECWGLRLTRNRFLHDIEYSMGPNQDRRLFGYLLVPAMAVGARRPGLKELSVARIDALLESAEISDNQFVGLTMAVMISARLGHIRIERNRVWGCSGGFSLAESAIGPSRRAFDAGHAAPVVGLSDLASTMTFAASVPSSTRPQFDLSNEALRKSTRDLTMRARMLDRRIAAGATAEAVEKAEPDIRIKSDLDDDETLLMPAIERIGAAIDSHFKKLMPVVHLRGNDVDVFGVLPHERMKEPVGPAGTVPDKKVPKRSSPAEFLALQMIFGYDGKGAGDVLVTDNRFASLYNPCVMISWARRLVVAGNIVVGSGEDDFGGAMAIRVDPQQAMLEVMANVVYRYPRIDPFQRPNAPSQDWSFVNRTF
jgi:hypothetical protein